MIAFSAVVGMGMFLQCGKVIFSVGPGLAVLVYLLSGAITYCAIACLGEMTALFPVKGGLFVFPRRFLDAGVGYAAGWMAW
jgi:amino acid transporter